MSLTYPEPTHRVARAAETFHHALAERPIPCRGDVPTDGLEPSDWDDDGPRNEEAAVMCRRCSVRNACLAYALEAQEPIGVWGGLTAKQRRKITRGR